MCSQTGRRQEINRKRLGRTRFRRLERERVVKFAFGKFELRVNDLFHVEALNPVAKASFLYVG